jgi:hypothetical protein
MGAATARLAEIRHCEERSDEAIQDGGALRHLDCFAALAMTEAVEPQFFSSEFIPSVSRLSEPRTLLRSVELG